MGRSEEGSVFLERVRLKKRTAKGKIGEFFLKTKKRRAEKAKKRKGFALL